jgi:hypothetical protein
MRATCSAHLILRALITLAILGEEYKPCSYSCSFLQPPVTSSLLGPNILSTLFSNTLNLCSSLNVRYKRSMYLSVNSVVVIKGDAFVRRFSFNCEKYIIQVRTYPTKPTCGIYYGEVRVFQFGSPQIRKPEYYLE